MRRIIFIKMHKLLIMKKNILISIIFSVAALVLLILPACSMTAEGSLKTITKPYIAQYRCIEARLGEENLLDDYEDITITLLDREELEVSFKPKGKEKHSFQVPYTFDPKTHELSGEAGILGYRLKEKVIIENGSFTISKALGKKQLVMKFQVNG